jgi:hypothetical protein
VLRLASPTPPLLTDCGEGAATECGSRVPGLLSSQLVCVGWVHTGGRARPCRGHTCCTGVSVFVLLYEYPAGVAPTRANPVAQVCQYLSFCEQCVSICAFVRISGPHRGRCPEAPPERFLVFLRPQYQYAENLALPRVIACFPCSRRQVSVFVLMYQ